MSWNHDLTTAPHGYDVDVERIVKGQTITVKERVNQYVWLATICGVVTRSYWIEQTKFSPARWSGLAANENPIAWQPYIVPVHPDKLVSAAINPEHLPILDDVGGGL